MKLRILLVDDHTMSRDALRLMLEMEPDIEVVGEVSNGLDVLEAVQRTRPDVVCMDVNMPQLNGIDATRQVLAAHPEVKVIGLSVHASIAIVGLLCRVGANGYVIKSDAGGELPQAIRCVMQGQHYFSRALGVTNFAELERYMGHSGGHGL